MDLATFTLSLLLFGSPAEEGAAPAATATLDEYRAARQKLDQAMRAKAVIYADLPRALQQQVDESNTAYSAANFAAAIKALGEPTAWTLAVVVDKAFVADKFARGTMAGRMYTRSPTLPEEQTKAILARLDKAAEALNADQVEATNAALNELFDFLKSLPAPEPPKTPPPEP